MHSDPVHQPKEAQARLGRAWTRLPVSIRRRLAIAVGGAIGTGMRAGLAAAIPPDTWPWATFIENVSGAFLLGFLLTRLIGAARATTVTIPLFCTGLLGSYTTFSTFVVEIVRLGDGRPLVAILYAISSVALGLVSAYAGSRLAERRP